MGKQRGPKPQPPELRIARGNPSKRAIPTDIVVHDSTSYGEPPEHLTAHAKAEWRRMAPLLDELGLSPDVAKKAFEMYCQHYGDWRAAREAIKKEGLVVHDAHNKRSWRNPAVVVANQAAEKVLSFLQEFGLTPSSKTRVRGEFAKKVVEDKKVDPWDKVG